MERYKKLKDDNPAAKLDRNNCSVIAVAIACRVPYNKARDMAKYHGRKPGRGMYTAQILYTAQALHCEVTQIYTKKNPSRFEQPNGCSYTPKTISNVLKKGYFICFTKTHCFAVVNGVVEDWAQNRNHRIISAYRVTVPKGKGK